MLKYIAVSVFLASIATSAFATDSEAASFDVYLPGVSQAKLLQLTGASTTQVENSDQPYTIISYTDYKKTLASTQQDIQKLISQIQSSNNSSDYVTNVLKLAGNYLQTVPYGGGEGEGEWCNRTLSKTGCMHIQQTLAYRTDSLNCQTFVQLVLALVNAKDLNSYNVNFVKIAYGAEVNQGFVPKQFISYANRNNFPVADFNAVNQRSGLLQDVTGQGVFTSLTKTVPANITRANWFAFQYKPSAISNNVLVFSSHIGDAMAQKFANHYGDFYKPQSINALYIPKTDLVTPIAEPTGKIGYVPNTDLINQIQTPSVVEIIRDDSKWFIGGVNIADLIGSGIASSHMAFLYHQHFNKGETIYQKTYCFLNSTGLKECKVTPQVCSKAGGCLETMMLAATSAYPSGYLWTHNSTTDQYNCVAPNDVPQGSTVLTTCNRVTSMPFGDYVTFQYNNEYIYMQAPSIVGFNIQKINSNSGS